MKTNQERKQQLATLLESGRRMLECAQAGDWETVDELQIQCRKLSQDVFSDPPHADHTATYAAAISELLEINQSITALGENAREICMEGVGSMKRSRKAIKEYTTNAG